MKLSDTSYAVTGLGATPPWVVNAGFIVGQARTLVIDTGMNRLAAQTIFGYATAVRPENDLLVINCEPHFDHIGGNGFFREQGADIYGHPDIHRTAAQFQAEKDEYNQSITNPIRQTERETEAFFTKTDVVNPNRPLAAGDRFDLGGVDIEIIATPGHTPLNLSVYNRMDGVLFCADCIVTGYIPNLEGGQVEDWQSWLVSLDTIAGLNPKVVLPGHGNVLRSAAVGPAIERMRRIIEQAIRQGRAPTVSEAA